MESQQGTDQRYIKRITLFKIPKEEDIEATLEQYKILRTTAQKVRNTRMADLHYVLTW